MSLCVERHRHRIQQRSGEIEDRVPNLIRTRTTVRDSNAVLKPLRINNYCSNSCGTSAAQKTSIEDSRHKPAKRRAKEATEWGALWTSTDRNAACQSVTLSAPFTSLHLPRVLTRDTAPQEGARCRKQQPLAADADGQSLSDKPYSSEVAGLSSYQPTASGDWKPLLFYL